MGLFNTKYQNPSAFPVNASVEKLKDISWINNQLFPKRNMKATYTAESFPEQT